MFAWGKSRLIPRFAVWTNNNCEVLKYQPFRDFSAIAPSDSKTPLSTCTVPSHGRVDHLSPVEADASLTETKE